MSKHIIQAINFNLVQDGSNLLSNLTWTADESDWIEIKGLNNSGKTSFLNTLYGHTSNCSGQLFVMNYSMLPVAKNDLASIRRKIGYAKQTPGLLMNKTLRANLAMALNAADRITDQNFEEIIENLLGRLGLKDFLRKEIAQLSNSRQQLASIARALIHKPKLILLDQSLDYLDYDSRDKIIELIQEYRTTERATILSSTMGTNPSTILNSKVYKLEDGSLRLLME